MAIDKNRRSRPESLICSNLWVGPLLRYLLKVQLTLQEMKYIGTWSLCGIIKCFFGGVNPLCINPEGTLQPPLSRQVIPVTQIWEKSTISFSVALTPAMTLHFFS